MELQKLRTLTGELLVKVRNLSLDLRPSMLDDLGLMPALEWNFKRYNDQTHIRVLFKHDVTRDRFLPPIETVVYRIVQEALTNIARHSGAREAGVTLVEKRGVLMVNVEDKGDGFKPDEVLTNGQSMGIIGMRERIEAVNGRLDILSSPGKGTLLTAVIPLVERI